MERWAAEAASPEVTALMFRNAVKQNFAGQLFVRLIEVPPKERKLAIGDEDLAFLDLPFDEAVAFFKKRFPGDDEAVDFVLRAYVRDGEENTRLLRRYLAQRARDTLQRTLELGGTMEEFAATVRAGQAGLGIEPISHGYLENCFRTQTATAYGAGRFRQINDPVVVKAKPYLEFRTVLDASVRDAHQALEGTQWETADPLWHRINTPLSYNCRCQLVTLDADEHNPAKVMRTIPDIPGLDRFGLPL